MTRVGVAPNVLVDLMSMDELVGGIRTCLARRVGGIVVTVNVSIARQVSRGALEAVRDDVIFWTVDGVPIQWLARLVGNSFPARLTGADLLAKMPRHLRDLDVEMCLLGSSASDACDVIAERYPDVACRGVDLPLRPIGDEALFSSALSSLPACPAVVFIGLGFPKQEWLSGELFKVRPDCVYIGSGSAANFLSGSSKRAPLLLQRFGVEWLWRLFHEPARLWRRYLIDDFPWFVAQLLKLAVRFKSARREPRLPDMGC